MTKAKISVVSPGGFSLGMRTIDRTNSMISSRSDRKRDRKCSRGSIVDSYLRARPQPTERTKRLPVALVHDCRRVVARQGREAACVLGDLAATREPDIVVFADTVDEPLQRHEAGRAA